MKEAIAYHGWGFDQTCWQPWLTALSADQYRVQLFDRGYFGTPVRPIFSDRASFKLLLVHSYGLHFCPFEQLQQADRLVMFSCFRTFHPDGVAQRRSKRVLAEMIRQFRDHPQMVLDAFKVSCYSPYKWNRSDPVTLNIELLLTDLIALDTVSLSLQQLKSIPEILLFHGANDQIVPIVKSQEIADHLPVNKQLIPMPGVGHALPFTHFEDCLYCVRANTPSFSAAIAIQWAK